MALGAYAGLGHLDLGPAPSVVRAAGASLDVQSAQLDAMESDLSAALAENPPQLPGIPKYPPVRVPKVPKPRVVQVAYVTTTPVKKHHDKKYEKDKKESERAKHEAEQRRERAKHEAEKRREEEKKKREEEKKEEDHD